MIKRSFGSTGLMVSALGLGCNNFGRRLDLEKTRTVVDSAIEAGINFFDTADVYGDRGGSETFLGAVLGNRRKDVILATKFGLPMDAEGHFAGGSRRATGVAGGGKGAAGRSRAAHRRAQRAGRERSCGEA
jgi:aryl-alcohol dehydrogenase-like predicted oxidoreductase